MYTIGPWQILVECQAKVKSGNRGNQQTRFIKGTGSNPKYNPESRYHKFNKTQKPEKHKGTLEVDRIEDHNKH